jgi:hypothetical protein
MTIAGCGGSGSTQQATTAAPSAASSDPTPIVSRPAPTISSAATPTAKPKPTATAAPIAAQTEANIPPDARYTLFCARIAGVGHIERARAIKEQLVAQTGLRDWYLQHTDEGSMLYLGYYRAIDTATPDPALQADAQRAQKDLAMVKAYRDQAGNRIFAGAIATALEQPDPEAPPEWSLLNTDPKYFWTVQESAFTDPSTRKSDALKRVQQIREAGFQAYYYHGESVSSVCVGLWPESAVENADAVEAAVPNAKRNERDYTLVVDSIGLPPDKLRQIAGDKTNVGLARAVKTLKDPTLIQTTKDFPHSTNTEYDRVRVERDGKIEYAPRPGMVVQIPRTKVAPANAPAVNGNEPDLRIIDPDAAQKLDQRLKGIDR